MGKYTFVTLAFLAVTLSGCGGSAAIYNYIESNKIFEKPSDKSFEFVPTKAVGKETITKGTDKIIDTTNFKVTTSKKDGIESISISKGGVRVTVFHAPFNFLKDKFGLYDSIKHQIGETTYFPKYLLSGYQVYYHVDNVFPYQAYHIIPFNQCINEIYRNDHNKQLLDDFNKQLALGYIQPLNQFEHKTLQEIKSSMEVILGQRYCSSYYKSNIVFHVTVENLGAEKIRLYPTKESVVIDKNNSQYNSFDNVDLKENLSKWEKQLVNIPRSRNNPQIGLYLTKKPTKNKTYPGYPEYEQGLLVLAVDEQMPGDIAGIKEGDIITEIDRMPDNEAPASGLKGLFGKSKDKNTSTMAPLEGEEDITKLLSTKIPGDKINVTLLRNGQKINKSLTLKSEYDLPRPNDIRLLAGGNVYPGVIYDGFLVFDTAAMLNNYQPGSTIKLIIPLIGTTFDAADRPIRSFEYEFEFKLYTAS